MGLAMRLVLEVDSLTTVLAVVGVFYCRESLLVGEGTVQLTSTN